MTDPETAKAGSPHAAAVGWRPYAMMTVAFFLLALNVIVGRAAHADIPPVGLSFWRWLLAGLVLLPFAYRRVRAQQALLRANWKTFLGLAFVLILCGNTMVYVGLQFTTALNGGLIPVSRPVIILLLAYFLFRGSVTGNQWIGIGIAVIGVFLVVCRGDPAVLAGLTINPGDIWIFVSSIAIASYQVLVAKVPREIDGLVLLQALITFGVLLLLPLYLWEAATIRPVVPTWPAVGAILYTGLFPSIVAIYLMNTAIGIVGPARAGIFNYLQPIFVAIIAVTVLGEQIEWYHPAALILVAVGITISSRKGGR